MLPAEAAAKPACPAQQPDPLSAVMAARACGGRVEVLSQRTETTLVWARPEGGFSTEIYAGPVRFKKNGPWRAVDLTLQRTADGAVEPAGHPRGLRFSGATTGSGEQMLARVETGDDSVSMLWTGPLPAPVLAANTATYREVRPGVDLLLTATRLGFEQSLVVKNRAAAAQVATMTVPLRSDDLRFVADGPASFAIRDAAGTTVGRVPTPMMWDSSVGASGERTREKSLAVQLRPRGSADSAVALAMGTDAAGGTGAVDLQLTADQAWLQDPKTTYPVTLDPQIELDPTSDTIVRNDELSTSGKPDHSGADYLAYGKATSYLARSFMQWPAAQFAGARITSATLNLWNWYSGSCAQTGWLVWDTAPYTNPIWWDTAPALLTNDGYSTQTAGFNSSCNDAWVNAGVAPLFQRAADAGKPTVYMGLTSYNETNPSLSWKQVRSRQAPNTAQIPVVRIDYEYPPQAGLYRYGVNYPYGLAAVDYAYSDQGMWKNLNGLRYLLNRYKEFWSPTKYTEEYPPPHEWNEAGLIDQVAPLDVRQTALDVNHHLLFDYDYNDDVDPVPAGFAFHEHFGKGVGGADQGRPYHLFWFDDNWLARHMAQAYSRPQPNGLSDNGSQIRWQIISGDQTWTPYDQLPIKEDEKNQLDRLVLDGLYYLSAGSQQKTLDKWNLVLGKARPAMNPVWNIYDYPGLFENYHIGLTKLFADLLLVHHTGLTALQRRDLEMHSASLRSQIVFRQQRLGGTGTLLGWTTDTDLEAKPKSLMNIETLAVNALALGAGAKLTYSPGQAPLQTPAAGNYRRTATGLLQAVPGTSTPGHLTFGPNHTLAPGSYNVEFVMRSVTPAAGTEVANIEVYDARTNSSVKPPEILRAERFATDGTYDRFLRFTLPFTVSSADNSLEFRVWWYGGNPLDIAEIRVR
ncbi:DNRLRE domain-containing protein [Kibdelosporangium banguiense]|uniref:DNRLRE domain-containing protein n=1 Tax=Kibdelosporangium banguiense TaxID=1365924 RepID=UPI001AE3D65B|nr:DNRLRE domain-containing protein [Kibdelosporangium banguiense]